MIEVFFLATHEGAVTSFAKALSGKGFKICLPGKSLQNHLHYGRFDLSVDSLKDLSIDIEIIEYDRYINDAPDIVVCNHFLTEAVMYSHVKLMRERGNIVLFCLYTQGFSVPHNLSLYDAVIALDYPTFVRARDRQIPAIHYWPYVDFEFWDYSPPDVDLTNISMFCNDLQGRPSPMPSLFKALSEASPMARLKNYEWLPQDSVKANLLQCAATLSIKPNEGYGYSVIESMATGRPVFIYAPLMKFQTYLNWCIDGKTCLFFNSVSEFVLLFERYSSSVDFRQSLQVQSATTIRQVIDNRYHNDSLANFLHKLYLRPTSLLIGHVPHTELFIKEFINSCEIWRILSSKIWWDPLAYLKNALSYNETYGLRIDLNLIATDTSEMMELTRSTGAMLLSEGEYSVFLFNEQVSVGDKTKASVIMAIHVCEKGTEKLDLVYTAAVEDLSTRPIASITLKSDESPVSISLSSDITIRFPIIFLRPSRIDYAGL